eukprot:1160800-Pelagomonas_calceolata.AAC.2
MMPTDSVLAPTPTPAPPSATPCLSASSRSMIRSSRGLRLPSCVLLCSTRNSPSGARQTARNASPSKTPGAEPLEPPTAAAAAAAAAARPSNLILSCS